MKLSTQKPKRILPGEETLLQKKDEIPDDVNRDVLCLSATSEEQEAEINSQEESEGIIANWEAFADRSPLTQKTAAEYEKELQLLNQWYSLDENCIPAVYRLQPIWLVILMFSFES